MPISLATPRGAMKPPLGASINMEHPFSHGLVISALLNEYGSVSNDSVSGARIASLNVFTANGSTYRLGSDGGAVDAPSWGSNTGGTCVVFNSQFNNISLGSSSGFPADAVTVAIVRRKTDTTARDRWLFNVGSAAANTLINIHCPWGDGTVYWAFRNNTQEFAIPGLTFTTDLEKWVFTAGPNGQTVWRNGVKVGNNTTPMTARATSTTNISLGDGGSNTGADLQEINSVHAVGVQWSDDMCRWWCAEPYAHFYYPDFLLGFEIPDITAALTGIAATAAAGLVGVDISGLISGLSATVSAGSMLGSAGPVLIGVVGTGATGSLGVGGSSDLTGIELGADIGSLGALGYNISGTGARTVRVFEDHAAVVLPLRKTFYTGDEGNS